MAITVTQINQIQTGQFLTGVGSPGDPLDLANLPANTVIGNATGGSAGPAAIPISSLGGALWEVGSGGYITPVNDAPIIIGDADPTIDGVRVTGRSIIFPTLAVSKIPSNPDPNTIYGTDDKYIVLPDSNLKINYADDPFLSNPVTLMIGQATVGPNGFHIIGEGGSTSLDSAGFSLYPDKARTTHFCGISMYGDGISQYNYIKNRMSLISTTSLSLGIAIRENNSAAAITGYLYPWGVELPQTVEGDRVKTNASMNNGTIFFEGGVLKAKLGGNIVTIQTA